MIQITILTGIYAGRTAEMSLTLPEEILGDLMQNDWEWSVDYSQATEEEKFVWFRQDLACRIVRAIKEGRSVFFLGTQYRAKAGGSPEELMRIIGEIEDVIVNSGRVVSIEYDDQKRGLSISHEGFVS